MEFRTLGRTGVQVSRFGLGTMVLGAWGNTDHDDCIRLINRAVDGGINLIDTADVYAYGESEEIVGQALAGRRRDDVVLATKFHNAMDDDPNHRGNSRRWISTAVEDSLRRLRTDHADYFEQMQSVFTSATAFRPIETPEELSSVLTDFEAEFLKQGLKTNRAAHQLKS